MTKTRSSRHFKWWHDFVNWIGTKNIVIKLYKKWGRPIDKRLLKWSKGRFSLMLGKSVGVLHTIGAKSGLARETSLLYVLDNERIVLIASNFGSQTHPAWYRNLVKNPAVQFTYRRRKQSFMARIADEKERETLWEKCLAHYRGFDNYQERVSQRQIPLVVLEPIDKG